MTWIFSSPSWTCFWRGSNQNSSIRDVRLVTFEVSGLPSGLFCAMESQGAASDQTLASGYMLFFQKPVLNTSEKLGVSKSLEAPQQFMAIMIDLSLFPWLPTVLFLQFDGVGRTWNQSACTFRNFWSPALDHRSSSHIFEKAIYKDLYIK